MQPFVVLAMLTMLLPTALRAQAPESRSGPWIALGAGGGSTRITCAICSNERHAGVVGSIRFGTALRPGLLVGAEADVWTREDGDDNRHLLGALTGAAYLYPDPGGRLHLKGGGGYIAYRADEDLASNLFGLVVGAGYELPLGERYVVANDLSLLASGFGTLTSGEQTVAGDVSVTLLRLGIALRRR